MIQGLKDMNCPFFGYGEIIRIDLEGEGGYEK